MLDIDNGMLLIKDVVVCGSVKNCKLEVYGQEKKKLMLCVMENNSFFCIILSFVYQFNYSLEG